MVSVPDSAVSSNYASAPRLVLLTSSSLKNKGDALMLRAVVKELGDGYRFALPSNVAAASPRAAREFYWCLCSDRPGTTRKRKIFNASVRAIDTLSSIAPSTLRHRARVIREDDIDICIDVSGYCYGDHWGEELIAKAARQYARYRARGVPVILMPKTWGPFDQIGPEPVDALIDNVDLAFARDHDSLAKLQACVSATNQAKLHFAPDYTHEVFPDVANDPDSARASNLYYVIPSYRVIDSGTMSLERYLDLLATARRHIEGLGGMPLLLIHETSSDTRFMEVAGRLGFAPDEVVQNDDPVATKRIISRAHAVVTSRLHGLYNALNSGVPAVTVPWSFKYKEALGHYGCEELLVDMEKPSQSLIEKIDMVADPRERERLSSAITERAGGLRAETARMWHLVHDVLAAHAEAQT